MPKCGTFFSRPDIGLVTAPEIATPYPRLGAGKRADWAGGRLAMISPDPPGIVEHSPSISGPAFWTVITAKDASILAHILVDPTVAWK